jgi:hypothetical protein
MEENIVRGLQEMGDSMKRVDSFRVSHKIKADSNTKRLQIELLKKLRSMDITIEQSLMGLI